MATTGYVLARVKSGEFYMFESATARNYYAAKRAEESGKTLDEMVESQEFDVGDDLRDLRKEFEDSSQMLKDIFKST
jgi:glutaredoxin 2